MSDADLILCTGCGSDPCECDDDEWPCTHCGGEGFCEQDCYPLWYDEMHDCHACGGSGKRRDQMIW